MKKYIIGRLIRSVVSIMAVVSIAMILIFCLMDRNDIFEKDGTLTKLGGKPDESIAYKYSTNPRLRNYTWGLFQEKQTENVFI